MEFYTSDAEVEAIFHKVKNGKRIDTGEAQVLYDRGSLGEVGAMADLVRQRIHGRKTYFNRNFHVEPTNVCIYTCSFCSYSRLIKNREDGWEYTHDDIIEIIKSYDDQPVTEVHIVGGVLPQYDVAFYEDLFKAIKEHRADLHIKALTPVEFHYIFKKEKISYEEGMQRMKAAGLDSIPGGGAEIFHPDIRKQIAGDKCTGDEWLQIHEIWHNLGMRSNATMLYGHIESHDHRIDHMRQLRHLQDKTGGFQTFIPLKFRNKENEMSHVPESTVVEDLRNYAIARIFLDNFRHIKAYWPMIGRSTAQLSLNFGVNDIDGTVDDTTKIYTMAGSEEQHPAMSTRELVHLIRGVGMQPIERDTLYGELKDFSDVVFSEDEAFHGYTQLPVVNQPSSS